MDVFSAISQRSSVRAYKATEVEEDKLRKILEAARLSPSAGNRKVIYPPTQKTTPACRTAFGLQGRKRVFSWRYHGLSPWGCIFGIKIEITEIDKTHKS